MSRRFRDQTSSSTPGIKFPRPQSHPSPRPTSASAPTSRSSRFARPSPTQHPVLTPRSSLVRSQDKPRLKDEIETSFEEADASSPQLLSRSRFSSSVSHYRNVVDELHDDEEDDLETNNRHQSSRRDPTAELEDHGLADLEFLETLRGTRASQISKRHDINSSSEDEDTFSSVSARKRRRLANRTDHDLNSLEDDYTTEHLLEKPSATGDNDDVLHDASSDSNLPSSPLATSTHPPSIISTRFRISTPTSLPKTTPRPATHKPTFRPIPANPHAASGTSLGHLPPAFSPSRRRGGRGGKDYLPGGAADTVRNWILGLGGAEEQAQAQGQGRQQSDRMGVEKVRVREMISGKGGGRCILVRDEVGKSWVLIRGEEEIQGINTLAGSRAGMKRVQVGKYVNVRMGWDVDLRLRDTDEQGEAGGGKVTEEVWKVAVLWHVLDE